MAVLVVGVGLGFTACSDDDDDNNGTEQRSDVDPLDNDEARTAFRWLCVLSNVQTLDANWQSKTYEPSVGEASENSEYTRIVVVNDLEEAKIDFSKLADKDPSELGAKVTIDGGAAGTMVWEPSATGAANLAVVTVTSRIMPHLQKLVYCTEDQKGQNGSLFGNNMKGTPYYRFGDVIQDPDGYYWVCVRPCFAANESDKTGYTDTKGDSHWINIFNASQSGNKKNIPKDNVYDKFNNLAKYKYQTILLPTGLPYNRQHLYNLTQLLWALLNPDAYAEANEGVSDRALGGFPYIYHAKNYLRAVAQYWDENIGGYTIWEKLFNRTHTQLQNLKEIRLFYQGKSWIMGNSGTLWVYKSMGYQPGYTGKESQDKVEFDFVNDGFDVQNFCGDILADELPSKQFVEQDGKTIANWVVRYKTGEQLMTAGKFSYYTQIASKDGNQKDVYRYNAKTNDPVGSNCPLKKDEEITVKVTVDKADAQVGNIMASDGNFYKRESDIPTAEKPVALVVYIGNTPDNSPSNNYDYHGLACAYGGATTDMVWDSQLRDKACFNDASENPDAWLQQLNGIERTRTLAGDNSHDHVAAKFANSYAVAGFTPSKYNFSNWFLPTAGQFVKALAAMGCPYVKNAEGTGYRFEDYDNFLVEKFRNMGATSFNFSISTWTSTEFSASHAIYMTLMPTGNTYTSRNAKNGKIAKVRPFIAF